MCYIRYCCNTFSTESFGCKKNDIVLCQNFTFIGSAYPIIYCDAKPIFIGSESESWNMCPITLRNTILKLKEEKKSQKQ